MEILVIKSLVAIAIGGGIGLFAFCLGLAVSPKKEQ